MRLALALVTLLASCASTDGKAAPPVIVSAVVGTSSADTGTPMAVARTNLRQTFIRAEVGFIGEIMTAGGMPIFIHAIGHGRQLYVDRDADVDLKMPLGHPLPSSAKVLFPRIGEAEELGVSFDDSLFIDED